MLLWYVTEVTVILGLLLKASVILLLHWLNVNIDSDWFHVSDCFWWHSVRLICQFIFYICQWLFLMTQCTFDLSVHILYMSVIVSDDTVYVWFVSSYSIYVSDCFWWHSVRLICQFIFYICQWLFLMTQCTFDLSVHILYFVSNIFHNTHLQIQNKFFFTRLYIYQCRHIRRHRFSSEEDFHCQESNGLMEVA